MSGKSNGNGNNSGNGADGGNENGSSTLEKGLIVISVIFAVALFTFVAWQAVATPESSVPNANVTDTRTLPNGDVLVTVFVTNNQDVGIVSATIEVQCDTPPPELTMDHIPVDDRRKGYITCPPGTQNPEASVSMWTET